MRWWYGIIVRANVFGQSRSLVGERGAFFRCGDHVFANKKGKLRALGHGCAHSVTDNMHRTLINLHAYLLFNPRQSDNLITR